MANVKGGEKPREMRRAARRAALARALAWAGRAGALSLAVLWVWGSLEARARVRSEPRFDLSSWKLELGDLPAWAPQELVDEVAGIRLGADGDEPLTVFTPRLLAKVRGQLLACAWIREVARIRLRYPGPARSAAPGELAADLPVPGPAPEGGAGAPGGIELSLELRVPIAGVAAGGAFHLADRDGVRLSPPLSLERLQALGLPAVVGGEVRAARRPPSPGVAWEDRDVREGLAVARILFDAGIRSEFPDAPIRAIDISSAAERARPGECEIVLSAGGLRLGWGRSPISPGARTLSPPEILQNLRRVLGTRREWSPNQLVLLYTSPPVLVKSVSP